MTSESDAHVVVCVPSKRGTFIEFRSGMFNISPIGRNCSREERNDYEKFDLEHNIRKNMVAAMKKEFSDLDLSKYRSVPCQPGCVCPD